jgi:hypothetical protein
MRLCPGISSAPGSEAVIVVDLLLLAGQMIAAGIHEIVRHPGGLRGSVVYLQRQPRD